MRVFLQLFQLFFVINLGIQNAISLMVHVNHSLSSLSFPLFFHRHFQSWGRGTGELKPPTSHTLVPPYLLVSASLRFSGCKILRNFAPVLPLPATLGIPLLAPSSLASRRPPAPFSSGLLLPCSPHKVAKQYFFCLFCMNQLLASS